MHIDEIGLLVTWIVGHGQMVVVRFYMDAGGTTVCFGFSRESLMVLK